jgi:hypothetical protein
MGEGMNCKPGDLAVIVGGYSENYGKFVRVIGFDRDDIADWECEALQSVMSNFGIIPTGSIGYSADCYLRPIRDQDGTDETLLWAPVPKEKVKA